MMRQRILLLVLVAAAFSVTAQDKVAVKPSGPRPVGPPPLPIEKDVLRYVFNHFPDENRDEVMAFIGENFKAELPEFQKLANEDASRAASFMIDLVNDALKLIDLAKKDKPLAQMMLRQKELERKAERKAKEVMLAEGAEKEKMTADLRSLLDRAFDTKQQLMKRDLAGMQEQLERLSDMIEKRNVYKKQIIEQKLNEMTMEDDYLKW